MNDAGGKKNQSLNAALEAIKEIENLEEEYPKRDRTIWFKYLWAATIGSMPAGALLGIGAGIRLGIEILIANQHIPQAILIIKIFVALSLVFILAVLSAALAFITAYLGTRFLAYIAKKPLRREIKLTKKARQGIQEYIRQKGIELRKQSYMTELTEEERYDNSILAIKDNITPHLNELKKENQEPVFSLKDIASMPKKNEIIPRTRRNLIQSYNSMPVQLSPIIGENP